MANRKLTNRKHAKKGGYQYTRSKPRNYFTFRSRGSRRSMNGLRKSYRKSSRG